MKGVILIVDDQNRIEPILERALSNTTLSMMTFVEIPAAKRQLLQNCPELILSATEFRTDKEGGFRLAREVSEHETLSKIPVLLVTDNLSEEVIRKASESGAKTLLPWPLSPEALLQRISHWIVDFLPKKEVTTSSPVESGAIEMASVGLSTDNTSNQKIASPAVLVEKTEQKLQLAQRLLAKVLHNLKTSHLLHVVDMEDVPRVVSEITRAVCGAGASATGKSQAAEGIKPVANASDVQIDLESVFQRKK